jgi:hypothetical protein
MGRPSVVERDVPAGVRVTRSDDLVRRIVAWRFAVFGGFGSDTVSMPGTLPRSPSVGDYEEIIIQRGLWDRYLTALGEN